MSQSWFLALRLLCLRLWSALKNPPRRKTIRGVPNTISAAPVPRIVGSQHFNNVWPP
jgi:hypothetical protein